MKKRFTLIIIGMLVAYASAYPQWTDDYGKNTQITPTGLSFYDCDVKSTPSGTSYVFFITPSKETLSMRLQILDKNGNKLMGRGGETVSEEANKTWTTQNQYVLIDDDDNALIAVQDYRNAPEQKLSTYTIYKYASDGSRLWGDVMLNDGNGYEMVSGLTMCCCNDGGYVFAYEYSDKDNNKDYVRVEKLDGDGHSLWNKIIAEDSYLSMPYPYVFNAGNGNIMLVYVSGGSTMKSHLMDNAGEPVNDTDLIVYTGGFASQKLWEVLHMEKGPDNGALITCVNEDMNAVVSYIKNDGTVGFNSGTSGVILNNDAYVSGEPAVAFCPDDNSFVCAYKPFDVKNTDFQGLYLKKLSLQGEALWAKDKPVVEMQTDYQYSYYSIRNVMNGNVALFYQKYESEENLVNSYMQTYDKEGNNVAQPLLFTKTNTMKVGLTSSELIGGEYFLTSWQEKRNGSDYSIFMQKVPVSVESSIKNIPETENGKVVRKEYFTIAGEKLEKPLKGVNVEKTVYEDCKSMTRKIVIE